MLFLYKEILSPEFANQQIGSDLIIHIAFITKFKPKRNWNNLIINWEWNRGLLPCFMNYYICVSSINKNKRDTNSFDFPALASVSGPLGLDSEVLLYIQLSFTVLLCNSNHTITHYPNPDVVAQFQSHNYGLSLWHSCDTYIQMTKEYPGSTN